MHKFEFPSIRLLITSDSPACFELKEARIEDQNEISPATSGCHCEIPTPQCSCPCVCPCPCVCMCECVCQCQCICVCPSTTNQPKNPINGNPVLEQYNTIENDEEIRIRLGDSFLLRSEEFGALLFNKNTLSSYVCNKEAAEILSFIQNKNWMNIQDKSDLTSHLQRVFSELPKDIDFVIDKFFYIYRTYCL